MKISPDIPWDGFTTQCIATPGDAGLRSDARVARWMANLRMTAEITRRYLPAVLLKNSRIASETRLAIALSLTRPDSVAGAISVWLQHPNTDHAVSHPVDTSPIAAVGKLGLKLAPLKAAAEVTVVDHPEKRTGN